MRQELFLSFGMPPRFAIQVAVPVRAVPREVAREAIMLIDFRAFSGLEKLDLMQTPLEIGVLWPIPTLAWERFAIVWRTVNFAL
jgi:hypothetical protein